MKTKMHCRICRKVTLASTEAAGWGACQECGNEQSTFWDFEDRDDIKWVDLGPCNLPNYHINITHFPNNIVNNTSYTKIDDDARKLEKYRVALEKIVKLGDLHTLSDIGYFSIQIAQEALYA